MKKVKVLLPLIFIFILSGCGNEPKPMYYWSDYQGKMYSYLKDGGGDAEKSIAEMEKLAEESKAQNLPLAPGFNAHLGLLNLKAGHDEKFRFYLEEEKRLFPESSNYISFLLKKYNK